MVLKQKLLKEIKDNSEYIFEDKYINIRQIANNLHLRMAQPSRL